MAQDAEKGSIDKAPTGTDLSVCSYCLLAPRQGTTAEAIPLRICTRCRAAAYHDVTCQRQHYALHKASCRRVSSAIATTTTCMSLSVVIRAGPQERGNCLVATRPLRAGEPLVPILQASYLACTPWVPPVLLESRRKTHCAICFGLLTVSKASNMIRLSTDERCPVQACAPCLASPHGPGLRDEVGRLQACAPQIPKILASALLVDRLRQALQTTTEEVAVAWKEVAAMVAHPLSAAPNEDAAIHQQAVLYTVMALSSSNNSRNVSQQHRVPDILARLKVNAFTLTDNAGLALGIGLYRTAHYMNHSCVPTTHQSFVTGVAGRLPALELTLQRDVAAGEELTIAYMDTTAMDRDARRKELQTSYHFTCTCPACQ